MSNSDFDSDGFESAEDDDFEQKKPKHSESKKAFDSKTTTTTHSTKNVNKSNEKAEIADKFKALDVQENTNNDEDNWGWDDDDENDFNFDSKPKEDTIIKTANSSESLKEQSTPTTAPPQESNRINQLPGNYAENASAWSPWSGMVSLLSTASTGVASFTSHVSSVIESNIGIPDPEKFAQQQSKEVSESDVDKGNDTDTDTEQQQRIISDTKQQSDEKLLNLGSFVSNVTSISNRVISGGLDTLEGIGKKTMTILQENDAGLISKRKLLGLDNSKPVLSQVLREAKEKSEETEKTMKLTQKQTYRKQLHFETLFDDYHGLVHLEALEMLSKQASMKLQTLLMPLTGIALNELQQTMHSVNELCELNEIDQEDSPTHLYAASELEEKFKIASEDFDIPIDFNDILE